MQEKIVVPYAPILVESTRSIGYSFEAAVADIIDNSISASATDIRIGFMSKDPEWLCVQDNGWGMSSEELENAMRYGSQSSHEVRAKNDLGRFGLGLKMASLSQCRKVTVLTKKDGIMCGACWDLDYIIAQGNWALKTYSANELKDLPGYYYLAAKESGTAVLWEQFDRLKQGTSQFQKAFDEKLDLTRKHVALVFHRFLNDENPKTRISMSFNGEPVEGIDPFLTRHPATQPLSEQIVRINVCQYSYLYASELLCAFEHEWSFISSFPYYHILSLGCGGCADLMGFEFLINEKKISVPISYIGIDKNELWAPIHQSIDKPEIFM